MGTVKLMFKGDVAYTVGYVGPEEDRAIDKMLEGIAVSKSKLPCG